MDKVALRNIIDSTKTLKVLFVEDDDTAREALTQFMSTFFDVIVEACDGEDGWNKFQNDTFDLVITDINMPKLNGLELTAKIKEIAPNMPVLVVSAHRETDFFLESIKLNIDGYILKPFEMEQFFSVITRVVHRLNVEKELASYRQNLEKMVAQKTKELEHRCFYEYNTDLPNEVMLRDDLTAQEYNYMLLLDISHFSILNKEYGKDFATHIIRRTAQILQTHIHENTKLYKVESDRFAILLKTSEPEQVGEYCEQIISFFDTKNITVEEIALHVTFNIGVDTVRADISETLINCEYALDKSKELGSRHYEIFSENHSAFVDEKDAIKWLRLTRELILEEKIAPYFQPIMNTQTSEVYKYEALARGFYKGEIIAPYYFIASAEKLGLSTAITRLMINKSFAFFEDKAAQFSINLTERDLLEGYLINFLNEKLRQYNIAPNRVTFEILENITVAKSSKEITQKLNKLRKMGFKIAVDDFGIENSNFSRLLEIELDFIKIDGLFIKDLKENPRNRTITKAIVNLAKTLGIKTVAEYVEDKEIYELIKDCGIDYAQGYYIGKPEPELLCNITKD
ncbi:EAL domain-containing response regulator [Sulfurimonas sp.]